MRSTLPRLALATACMALGCVSKGDLHIETRDPVDAASDADDAGDAAAAGAAGSIAGGAAGVGGFSGGTAGAAGDGAAGAGAAAGTSGSAGAGGSSGSSGNAGGDGCVESVTTGLSDKLGLGVARSQNDYLLAWAAKGVTSADLEWLVLDATGAKRFQATPGLGADGQVVRGLAEGVRPSFAEPQIAATYDAVASEFVVGWTHEAAPTAPQVYVAWIDPADGTAVGTAPLGILPAPAEGIVVVTGPDLQLLAGGSKLGIFTLRVVMADSQAILVTGHDNGTSDIVSQCEPGFEIALVGSEFVSFDIDGNVVRCSPATSMGQSSPIPVAQNPYDALFNYRWTDPRAYTDQRIPVASATNGQDLLLVHTSTMGLTYQRISSTAIDPVPIDTSRSSLYPLDATYVPARNELGILATDGRSIFFATLDLSSGVDQTNPAELVSSAPRKVSPTLDLVRNGHLFWDGTDYRFFFTAPDANGYRQIRMGRVACET